jgi:DNA-binding transcriptional regulator LsrR (DeoR family)
MGSMPFALRELDSGALARKLAQKLGGEVLDLSAPAVADSPADAEVLRTQRDIRRALDLARAADVALVGIGSLDPQQSGFVSGGFLAAGDLQAMAAQGAVGDMGGHIFTRAGCLYDRQYDDRLIGLSLDDFKRIPQTIAVAAGSDKIQAILGALHTKAITTLVTDDRTAAAVLALEKAHGS